MKRIDKAETQERNDGRPSDPCVMVIFGASGDLTKRKLIPALHNLYASNLLPDEFAVLAFARRKMTTDDFRKKIGKDLEEFATGALKPGFWGWFKNRLFYVNGDIEDRESFERLVKTLGEMDGKWSARSNHLYYLAVAPEHFGRTIEQLGNVGLLREGPGHWRRVIIEKPFGYDLESARALNRQIGEYLTEDQIYRIDHYLGKETVQNILIFRFANGIFEPIWNRRYIDSVQVTVAEELGVEQRGGYYDKAGALRDMVPTHIFQLITLTAMEPPISFDADAVRDEQSKILQAMQSFSPEDVLSRTVRGQYREGTLKGKRVKGYRAEPEVPPDSITETYVAMKLFVDNWRWAGIPFYLQTGKRLPCRSTEIVIQFKRAPFILFRSTPVERLQPNFLVLQIQPGEGITLSFEAKIPGPIVNMGTVEMDFNYKEHFGSTPSTGYERLLYDCMLGDATLFRRADMVEAGWKLVAPILDMWRSLPPRDFPNYPAGTWGPPEAEALMAQDGRAWRRCER
jgi:glucose-6-phosphate 1-dehydrogenase